MTEALRVEPGEKVLEIGSGCGYQSAVLADLGAEVYTVEIVEELSLQAQALLGELGYPAQFRVGDGRSGWPEAAPFDGILVTAAPQVIPPALTAQLAPGGRMVIPVGDAAQDLLLLENTPRGVTETPLTAVRFVPLLEEPPHGNNVH
jgi:protein-L-isoaspartate(D-aspartate) O-methyltransferase